MGGEEGGLPPCQATSYHFLWSPTKASGLREPLLCLAPSDSGMVTVSPMLAQAPHISLWFSVTQLHLCKKVLPVSSPQ